MSDEADSKPTQDAAPAPPTAKTTPVLWADMSDGDDEEDDTYFSDSRHQAVQSHTRPPSRSSQMSKSTMEARAASSVGGLGSGLGGRGSSGQRQGQRPFQQRGYMGGGTQGLLMDRGGGRNFNPSQLVVQHHCGGMQRRQGGRGSNPLSRNQSASLHHISSPASKPNKDPPYKLHVAPLPNDVTQAELCDAFQPLKIKNVELGNPKPDKQMYALIEVNTYDDMMCAMTKYQNTVVGDLRVTVKAHKKKESPSFKIARSVAQLSQSRDSVQYDSRPGKDHGDHESSTVSAPALPPHPRSEGGGVSKGHKKALLCMLANDNDNTTRDTKIFGTGRPREERLDPMEADAQRSPAATAPAVNPDSVPQSPTLTSAKLTDGATPGPEASIRSAEDSVRSEAPLRSEGPVRSADVSVRSGEAPLRSSPPSSPAKPPHSPESQSVPPPMMAPSSPGNQMMNDLPPPPPMIVQQRMVQQYPVSAEVLAAHRANGLPPDGGLRAVPQYQQPQDVMANYALLQPKHMLPMGPQGVVDLSQTYRFQGAEQGVGYPGAPVMPQQMYWAPNPEEYGQHRISADGRVWATPELPPQPLMMAPPLMMAHPYDMMRMAPYYEGGGGVHPPEEVVTLPQNYPAARGPSPRQDPSDQGPNQAHYFQPHHPTVVLPSRMSVGSGLPPPRSTPSIAPQRYPTNEGTSFQPPPPPPIKSPSTQSAKPPPSRQNDVLPGLKPSYASVVGNDKKPKASAPTGEAIPFIPPDQEIGGRRYGGGRGRSQNQRGGNRKQHHLNTHHTQQQPRWKQVPGSHESAGGNSSSSAAADRDTESRSKLGHSDSCSTDDFLEFARGRKS